MKRLVFGEADPKFFILPLPPCSVMDGGCGHAEREHREPTGCHFTALGRGPDLVVCMCPAYVAPVDDDDEDPSGG